MRIKPYNPIEIRNMQNPVVFIILSFYTKKSPRV